MKATSYERDRRLQAPSLTEGGEARPARRGRKKRVLDCPSRTDRAPSPSIEREQRMLFDLDGDEEPETPREIESRPALGARKRASKFAPEQMVFEWSEHPPTTAGN